MSHQVTNRGKMAVKVMSLQQDLELVYGALSGQDLVVLANMRSDSLSSNATCQCK